MGPGVDHVLPVENIAFQCGRDAARTAQNRHHRRRHFLDHVHLSAPAIDAHTGPVVHVCLVVPSAGVAEVEQLEGSSRVDVRRLTPVDDSGQPTEDDFVVVCPPQCILVAQQLLVE